MQLLLLLLVALLLLVVVGVVLVMVRGMPGPMATARGSGGDPSGARG